MINILKSSIPKKRFISTWKNIPAVKIDSIMKLTEEFKKDTNNKKVNLAIGAYKDESNSPYVLNSVKKAKALIANSNHEYSGIIGNEQFIKNTKKFLFAKDEIESIASVQTLSGTGACKLAAEFLFKVCKFEEIYLPNITWGNHVPIMEGSGLKVNNYKYYKKGALDLDGILNDINIVNKSSLFLFHVCAHNPTGTDPSQKEWVKILDSVIKKNHTILFDCAYQGFSSGDYHKDAFPVRYLHDRNYQNYLVAQSYSKNFGLYGERIGALNVMTSNEIDKENVLSQLKGIIRPSYSNPPINGAKIINEIFNDEDLFNEWQSECLTMANRMNSMRMLLKRQLEEKVPSKKWDHIKDQNGMFCFSEIPSDIIDIMRIDHSIYMTNDGRISIAGVNEHNIDYITDSIKKSFDKVL